MFRVTLNNEFLGPLIIQKNLPVDIDKLRQVIKRSDEFEGVIYQVSIDVQFIKDGRQYLKQAYEQCGGIDAEVEVLFEEWQPNTRKWEDFVDGQVDFKNYDLSEDELKVNVGQTGFQRKIVNLIESKVDLETLSSREGSALPTQSVINPIYHSKNILRSLLAVPQNSKPEWNSAQTYAINNVVKFKFQDNENWQTYKSLQNTNRGHLPNTSPIWWQPIEEALDETQQINVIQLDVESGGFPIDHTDYSFIIYGQFDTSVKIIDDLLDSYSLTPGWTNTSWQNATGNQVVSMPNVGRNAPADVNQYKAFLSEYSTPRNEIYKAAEEAVTDIQLDLNFKFDIHAGKSGGDVEVCDGLLGNYEILGWLEHRRSDGSLVTIDNIGIWNMAGCGGSDRNGNYERKQFAVNDVNVGFGDKFYLYHTVRSRGRYSRPISNDASIFHDFKMTAFGDGNFIKFSAKTTYAPSPVKSIMIYEAFQRCVQFVTNQIDCFRSDLLGRTDIVIPQTALTPYAQDGLASLIAMTNGKNLRAVNDKIITSIKEIMNFLNSIYCVGFGFEKLANGTEVLRLERREYFYNKNVTILSLGPVYDIRMKLNEKMFYNSVKFGYSGKLDINQTNGIDEFNTSREYSIPISNTSNSLNIATDIKSSGYQIEYQRRLTPSTQDSNLDDENFVVVMIRDGALFKTKKSEGYDYIQNVYEPSTGYNYDISPTQGIYNWLKFLAPGLIRSFNKVMKFEDGELNYKMITKKSGKIPIAEDGSIDLSSIEAIYEPMIYTFEHPLSKEETKLLKSNPGSIIEFSDKNGNKFESFVSTEGVDVSSSEGKASFSLLKAYRKPV